MNSGTAGGRRQETGGRRQETGEGRALPYAFRPTPYALRPTLYTLCALLCLLYACAPSRLRVPTEVISYREEPPTSLDLAMRFAPRLYIQPSEPYRIRDLIVLIHPQKPLIAYHFLWEEDIVGAGMGKECDHEIAWIEYDPISLKLVDLWTLWHRGLLHTEASVMEAKRHRHRPKLCVQWGQHGMLPFGWENLPTARPRVELRLHFALASSIQMGTVDSLKFQGDYSDYLAYSELIDTRQYVRPEKVVVGTDSNAIVPAMVSYTVADKQAWPYW